MARKQQLLDWFRDRIGQSVTTSTQLDAASNIVNTPARKIKGVNGTRVRLEATVINFDEEDEKYHIDFIGENKVQYHFITADGEERGQVGYVLTDDR